MVRTIMPGKGDTMDIMSPLIPFNLVVDTDVGLLCYIYKSYMDPNVFNKDFFIGKNVRDMVYSVYTRTEQNPLLLCINDKYRDSCDSLYNEFMNDKYEEILELSVKTEFCTLMRYFYNEPEINTTLVCEKQKEIDILKEEKDIKYNRIILSNELKEKEIRKFNQFYFKNINDATPYVKYLIDKTIYFSKYGYNINDKEKFVEDPMVILLSENNVINIIDVFNMELLNKMEDE